MLKEEEKFISVSTKWIVLKRVPFLSSNRILDDWQVSFTLSRKRDQYNDWILANVVDCYFSLWLLKSCEKSLRNNCRAGPSIIG